MKVSFITSTTNCYAGNKLHSKSGDVNSEVKSPSSGKELLKVNPAYFTFRARPDSVMLLAQSNKLLCAYSRKPMISPYELRTIFAKLSKKTNAQSATNFLKTYSDYMPEVEAEIFDMFKGYGVTGKKTYQDILIENYPDALSRLRQKQTDILQSTDEYIGSLGYDLSEELFSIRDIALFKVKGGNFGRSEVLEQLEQTAKEYKDSPKELASIMELYKVWYKLPRALRDYDAFIVKYSKSSHNDIAQRLLNMAVASVEHVKAYSNGGMDNLSNYALVRKLENTDRGDMNLAEYDVLNPEIGIRENLSKYLEDVCSEIKRGNPYFISHNVYPSDLRKNIIAETGWEDCIPEVNTNLRNSNIIQSSKKGANRYRQNRK